MDTQETLKTAFERNAAALSKRPSLGQKTGKVSVLSTAGLACEITSGSWRFKADMLAKVGGTETGPSPGIFEAGALGSCIAIMTKMWGAKLDVPIDKVEVEVEFDADTRFLYGLDEVPSHWSAIRYHITVESSASKEEVRRVLDYAHRQSHVRGDFEYGHKIDRKITIKSSKLM